MQSTPSPAPAQPLASVLFVCLGNICRSPLAEGVFRATLADLPHDAAIDVDSAGTGGWHAGEAPDRRSIEVARRFGIDISMQRARQVTANDFERFDLILAMDRSNEATLKARAARNSHGRIHLFMEFALGRRVDVPDPYYGGPDGFEAVYHMLREGSAALANLVATGERAVSG
jgi:Protein-tyrosine-phosphatase